MPKIHAASTVSVSKADTKKLIVESFHILILNNRGVHTPSVS
jgi:hypothetical protein